MANLSNELAKEGNLRLICCDAVLYADQRSISVITSIFLTIIVSFAFVLLGLGSSTV